MSPARAGEFGLRRAAPIFPVRDLGAALDFYDSLGFERSRYDDGYGFASLERLHLHLRHDPQLDPFANPSAGFVPTDDVDALHARWLGCGLWAVPAVDEAATEEARRRWAAGAPVGRISAAVEERPWGVREFALLDLDNNLLRFGRESG